mgnify:CR=1 FL=1
MLVDLDLKTRDVEPILSRVIEAGMLDQSLFFNGDFALIEKFRAIHAGVLPMPRARSLATTRQAGAAFAPEVIHIDPGFNDDATRDAARETDSRLWINALGEPDRLVAQGRAAEALAPLLQHGASIIQTDQPKAVIAWLAASGRR